MNVDLRCGDFREVLADIPDGSIDAIVTDPPYPREFLPLWGDLGVLAARVLKDRGVLLAWSGQAHLPEVLRRVERPDLTYRWTFCLRVGSPAVQVRAYHLNSVWKPILVLSRGALPPVGGSDLVTSPNRNQRLYEWAQSVEPARLLIERFTEPGETVLDPMMGVGSFGIAARLADRRFIGVELDEGRFAQAQAALADAFPSPALPFDVIATRKRDVL